MYSKCVNIPVRSASGGFASWTPTNVSLCIRGHKSPSNPLSCLGSPHQNYPSYASATCFSVSRLKEILCTTVYIIYDGKYIMCIHVYVFIYNLLVDVWRLRVQEKWRGGWGAWINPNQAGGGKGPCKPPLQSSSPPPPPLHGKNRKDGLHGPFSLEKELTTCIRPAPWIISMSKLASLNSFQYFCMADVKIYVMHFFFTVGLWVHNVILNIS